MNKKLSICLAVLLCGTVVVFSQTKKDATSFSTTARTDTQDYKLTISSVCGNPTPTIGIHSTYCWLSTVTCSVESVITDGGSNYICIGWTGGGSISTNGSSNSTGSIRLTNVASFVTWNWRTVPLNGTSSGSTIARTDTQNYHLTVSSVHGDPVPSIGPHSNYCWRSVVTCLVESVVNEGGINYSSTGWAGEGSVPSIGTSNCTGLVRLTNVASSVTWNWKEHASGETGAGNAVAKTDTRNYTLTLISARGNPVPPAGIHPNYCWHSTVTCSVESATTDGWLFMGWNGTVSTDFTKTNVVVFMDALFKNETALFSEDPDGDGLKNTNEWLVGSNPRKVDTDDDGFDDFFEVDRGLNPVVKDDVVRTYIMDKSEIFGLYSSNDVLDVAIGEVLIDVEGNDVTLLIQLEESNDLLTWTNSGDAVEWSRSASGKKFFRVKTVH